MYFIAIILFLLTIGGTFFLVGTPTVFLDIPSVLIILLITVPMLFASDTMGDLKRAFKVIINKKMSYTKLELQRSLEAVKLTMKLLIYSGFFGSLIGVVGMLRSLDKISLIGPNMAVALLTLFYALFGTFIFLPIKTKLKVMILSCGEDQ